MKIELTKIDFMEMVHTGLYDIVDSISPPGSFTFNELDRESVEFRFYLDGIVDQSMSSSAGKSLLILGS